MLRPADRPRRPDIRPNASRKRRSNERQAAANARTLMQQLLRLRAVVKSRLPQASDCRRLMRLAAAVRSRGASLEAAFLLLLVDRALRRPKLTALLTAKFDELVAAETNSVEAAWKAFVHVRRRKEARQQNLVLWRGPVGCAAATSSTP